MWRKLSGGGAFIEVFGPQGNWLEINWNPKNKVKIRQDRIKKSNGKKVTFRNVRSEFPEIGRMRTRQERGNHWNQKNLAITNQYREPTFVAINRLVYRGKVERAARGSWGFHMAEWDELGRTRAWVRGFYRKRRLRLWVGLHLNRYSFTGKSKFRSRGTKERNMY